MSMIKTQLVICAVMVNCEVLLRSSVAQANIPEDGRLNFTGLAVKYGQRAEEYDLTTEDGYILKLNHIIGDKTRPVLLVHGVLDTSDSFLLRGKTSLAIMLAERGHDVWAINARGNRYSRRHVTLRPDVDKAFWDFSVHQFGYYDMPVTIDFILNATGQAQLSGVGFSEGTTTMYVLGVTRPEYNEKIKVFICLAPIAFMHNTMLYMSAVIECSAAINRGLKMAQSEEFAGYYSTFKQLMNVLCTQKGTGYELCLRGGLFQLTGIDTEEIEENFLPVIIGHFPAGTSRKNLNHLAQIGNRRTFANYDYGPVRNRLMYDSKAPPKYDLSKVTMRVALFVAKNDRISTIKDVTLLRKQLPNVVAYRVMKSNTFNHMDYIWGRSSHNTVFPQIIELLEMNSL